MNKEQVIRLESLKADIILHLEQSVEAMKNDNEIGGFDWTFNDDTSGYEAQLKINKTK
jgi:hypothetical protein